MQHDARSYYRFQRYSALGGLFAALTGATTAALDLTDLLRAQLVLAVSAFDQFVHEVARLGALETFAGQRPATAAYLRFSVSLEAVSTIVTNPTDPTALDQEIRSRHSWLSFQKPDKVADAVRLVTDKALWEEVGIRIGMSAGDVKTRLSAIADRRNQIAHEADLDPTDLSRQTRWPIIKADADAATDFLETVGRAIFDVAT